MGYDTLDQRCSLTGTLSGDQACDGESLTEATVKQESRDVQTRCLAHRDRLPAILSVKGRPCFSWNCSTCRHLSTASSLEALITRTQPLFLSSFSAK